MLVFDGITAGEFHAEVYDFSAIPFLFCLLYGVRRNNPSNKRFVYFMLSAGVPFALAEAVLPANNINNAVDGTIFVYNGLALGGYALMFACVVTLTRVSRSRDSAGLVIDGILIGLAAWLLCWPLLLEPLIAKHPGSTVDLIFRSAYQPLCIVLVYLMFRLAFSNAVKTVSYYAFLVGMTNFVLGETLSAFQDAGQIAVGYRVFNLLEVVQFFAFGASVLHPSVRVLLDPKAMQRDRSSRFRIALIGIALFVPVLSLTIELTSPSEHRTILITSSFVLVFMAITRLLHLMQSNASLQRDTLAASMTDHLTGLPNRNSVIETLTVQLHQPEIRIAGLCVMLFDLDRFRHVNDSLGHEVGDEIIRTTARRLSEELWAGASVARLSADEFLVTAPAINDEGKAVALAHHLLHCFDISVPVAGGEIYTTASVGVAIVDPGMDVTPEDLLRNAETAMYRAKDAGRSCVAVFDNTMLERISRRVELENDLRRALDRHEFRVLHQPIVRIDTEQVTGFEALVRWEHPQSGLISPLEFIPIAEDNGLIVPIGNWVLSESLMQLSAMIRAGTIDRRSTVSVNLSPRQLLDESIVNQVETAIELSDLQPENVWLEVTESLMIQDPEAARRTLYRLSATGVRIAIDDFGTGYSSLSLLGKYPIHRIKIDRSFVNRIETLQNERALVRSIILMAHALGMDIVAEGVETVGQLNLLRDLGADYAQGYFYSRPIAKDAVAEMISSISRTTAKPSRNETPAPKPIISTLQS